MPAQLPEDKRLEVCRLLEWDTAFFGYRLGSVNGQRMDDETWSEILDWSQRQRIEGLYFLTDAGDMLSRQVAQERGFVLHGIRVCLDRITQASPAMAPPHGWLLRPALAEDVPALEAIARSAYTGSRFYSDPHFHREACDRMYEIWIRKSCLENFADAVFVLETEAGIVGYISCDTDPGTGEGKIPLVGLAEAWRGQGMGQYLLHHALHWFAQQQISRVNVVTDGGNIAAQRLYQKCGFRTQSIQLWFHKWFIEGSR
jgi:ribosomal protein S18 acetylase RimI-like enzyme